LNKHASIHTVPGTLHCHHAPLTPRLSAAAPRPGSSHRTLTAAAAARCKHTAGCCKETARQLLGPAPPTRLAGWLLMRPLWSWTWSAPQPPSQSGPCEQQQCRARHTRPPAQSEYASY
jgi:hypothetical protein